MWPYIMANGHDGIDLSQARGQCDMVFSQNDWPLPTVISLTVYVSVNQASLRPSARQDSW